MFVTGVHQVSVSLSVVTFCMKWKSLLCVAIVAVNTLCVESYSLFELQYTHDAWCTNKVFTPIWG